MISNCLKYLKKNLKIIQGNFLKSGKEFDQFKSLKTLIIDNNYYFNLDDFPTLPSLQTFSANKNNFNNLELYN